MLGKSMVAVLVFCLVMSVDIYCCGADDRWSDTQKELQSLRERLNKLAMENIKLKRKVRTLEKELSILRKQNQNASQGDGTKLSVGDSARVKSLSIKDLICMAKQYIQIQKDKGLTTAIRKRKMAAFLAKYNNRVVSAQFSVVDISEWQKQFGVSLEYISKKIIRSRSGLCSAPEVRISVHGKSDDERFLQIRKGQVILVKFLLQQRHSGRSPSWGRFQDYNDGRIYIGIRVDKITLVKD